MVNMDRVFSVKRTGQGNRYLHFRGSDSLAVEMPFASEKDARKALHIILTLNGEKKPYLFIDQALEEQAELETA